MKLGILEFGFYDSKNSDIDIIENIFNPLLNKVKCSP